jgi:phosphatidylserine/phosphatidylglycerophosphate/cardiolipin synthase-like enzyme
MNRPLWLLALAFTLSLTGFAEARTKHQSLVESAVSAYEQQHSYQVPAGGSVEVAFSPDEGSEHLVLKVIDSAQSEIRMLSYSFTSAPVVEALIRARHRGVAVTLVADDKGNRATKSRAAMSALVNAGAEVRTISVYAIHHDKVIVVDRDTVELGSFNYSAQAAHANSENVLVNWHNPQLAAVYLAHFERNYKQAAPYQLQY